jgi:hypothetical protein
MCRILGRPGFCPVGRRVSGFVWRCESGCGVVMRLGIFRLLLSSVVYFEEIRGIG